MEHIADVMADIEAAAQRAVVRAEGLGVAHGKRVPYAGLHGLNPKMEHLVCGCRMPTRRVPSVHIEEDGRIIHLQCGKEIARIVRTEPNGGM